MASAPLGLALALAGALGGFLGAALGRDPAGRDAPGGGPGPTGKGPKGGRPGSARRQQTALLAAAAALAGALLWLQAHPGPPAYGHHHPGAPAPAAAAAAAARCPPCPAAARGRGGRAAAPCPACPAALAAAAAGPHHANGLVYTGAVTGNSVRDSRATPLGRCRRMALAGAARPAWVGDGHLPVPQAQSGALAMCAATQEMGCELADFEPCDMPAVRAPRGAGPGELVQIATRTDLPLVLETLGLGEGVGIELGVARGTFSQQLLRLSRLRVLYSVDMWAGDKKERGLKAYKESIAKMTPFGHRSVLLKMKFEEALDLFPDEFFDFMYIDGYAGTGNDGGKTYRQWISKLKPGGLIAGDDYHKQWKGVVENVDKLAQEYGLKLYTTQADGADVSHKYPSWYAQKPAA